MEDRTKQEVMAVGERLPGFNATVNWLRLLSYMLRWVSAPLECFLRRNFGERYMSWLRLWVAYPFVLTFALVPTLAGKPSVLYWLIYVAFIGMGIWHRVAIWKRNRKGDVSLHSQCPGRPWGKLNDLARKNPEAFDTFIEPIACVMIALCLFGVDKVVGTWFLFASVTLLIHRQMDSMQRRNRYLDIIDSKIEAEFEGLMLKELDEKGDVVLDVYDSKMNKGVVPPSPQLRRDVRRQLLPMLKQPIEVVVDEVLPLQPV